MSQWHCKDFLPSECVDREPSNNLQQSFNISTTHVYYIVCLQVNDQSAALIVAQLLFLESENPEKPISLYINSPGGSVTAGMAIYDTVR